MNTTNILSVRFFIKQYKAKNFRAPIYARITIEGKSADVSLKRTVEISNWSAESGQAKGSRDDAGSINVFELKYPMPVLTLRRTLFPKLSHQTPIDIFFFRIDLFRYF